MFVLVLNWRSKIEQKINSSNFILQFIQFKVHGFNTPFVKETINWYFATVGRAQISRACPRGSITVQHLLGMNWIKLWITCAGMVTLSCLSAWTTHARLRGRSLCLEHVSPTCSKRVRLGSNWSGDMESRGEFGRCCWRGTVWCGGLHWALALSCWYTAPYNGWCPK